MVHVRQTCVALAALLLTSACTQRELRGKSLASADGRTYLIVADDNGGRCGSIKVDGADWAVPIGTPGALEPGTHEISCGDGAVTRFDVRSGTTFHFDYWGP
jgi:hypothetical protein